MMLLVALAVAAAQAAAAAPAEKKAATPAEGAAAPAETNCSGRKFEATIQVPAEDGTTRPQRMRLCGKEGQTAADWMATLKDAIDKVAANDKMPAAAKEQIISAVNAEISRVQAEVAESTAASLAPLPVLAGDTPAPAGPRSVPGPTAVAGASGVTLKSIPKPIEPSPIVEYSTVPAMPAPKPAVSTTAATTSFVPLLPPPLSFDCIILGQRGSGGPCEIMARDTMLTVKAKDNVTGPTGVRFVFKGEQRAEVQLAAMRKGQTRRMRLPDAVCSGIVGGEVEMHILRAPPGTSTPTQLVDRIGPMELRC